MELSGKVAIVTGAGRGIGKQTALSLAAAGTRVVLVSRTASQLEQVKQEITSAGGDAIAVPVDLGLAANCRKVVQAAIEAFGGVDILINNAGVLYSTDYMSVTEEEWDQVMNVNLKAPFVLSQTVLPEMDKRGEGYIINISSTAALTVPPGISTYGISKKAMIGLSEALYETAKAMNVKVSVVYPGMTDTEMLRGLDIPVSQDKWMKTEDIADSIIFLLTQSGRVVIRDMVPWSTGHDKI